MAINCILVFTLSNGSIHVSGCILFRLSLISYIVRRPYHAFSGEYGQMYINFRIRIKWFCHTMNVRNNFRPWFFAVVHQTDWKHLVPPISYPTSFTIPTYPTLLVFFSFVNLRNASFCQGSTRTKICQDFSVTPSKAALHTSPLCCNILVERYLLCFFRKSPNCI